MSTRNVTNKMGSIKCLRRLLGAIPVSQCSPEVSSGLFHAFFDADNFIHLCIPGRGNDYNGAVNLTSSTLCGRGNIGYLSTARGGGYSIRGSYEPLNDTPKGEYLKGEALTAISPTVVRKICPHCLNQLTSLASNADFTKAIEVAKTITSRKAWSGVQNVLSGSEMKLYQLLSTKRVMIPMATQVQSTKAQETPIAGSGSWTTFPKVVAIEFEGGSVFRGDLVDSYLAYLGKK